MGSTMERLHYSIRINAPKEKVWDTLIGETTYRQWTNAFHEGSHYVGNWEQGSKILFIGPGNEGEKEGGMVSMIAENRPYEFISIRHIGIVENGIEDTASDEAKKWAGGLENYTFREANGITELVIDMDSDAENAEMFNRAWPAALQKLKELAES